MALTKRGYRVLSPLHIYPHTKITAVLVNNKEYHYSFCRGVARKKNLLEKFMNMHGLK